MQVVDSSEWYQCTIIDTRTKQDPQLLVQIKTGKCIWYTIFYNANSLDLVILFDFKRATKYVFID